jgi:MFS family permease
MNTTSSTPSRSQGHGVWTLAVIMALISATGRPVGDTLATLTAAGMPSGLASALLYVAPTLAVIVALVIGRMIGRGWPALLRWSLFAILGMFVGIGTAFCLDLFAGVPDLVANTTGPLAEGTLLDTFLWIFTAYSGITGLMVGALALGGSRAVSAIQVEDVDAETLDVRKAERRMFGWAAVGMITLGLSCAGLVIARLAAEDARLIPAIVAVIAGVVSIVANYVIWRELDEMQRRHVVEGYSASAIVATLGAFVWALAQTLGYVPPIDATGVFLALLFVQTVFISFVSASVMGQSSVMGKPA